MREFVMSLAMVLFAGAVLAAPAKPAAAPAKPAATPAKPAALSLAEARKLIGAAIAKPELVTSIMKRLSEADQVTFVADLNAAIMAMPGSVDDKTATYLSVNRAALNGASKGNLTAVVAEIFATAAVESLTVINETFAADAFNRAANPNVTYTDAQFKAIAETVMKAVNARVASADNADVRSGFAALMMIRASNVKTAEMVDAVTAMLPESAKKIAKEEWFVAALADGEAKSYEPMLGMANADEAPQIDRVVRICGPQMFETILGDLAGSNLDVGNPVGDRTHIYDAVVTIQNVENGIGINGAGAMTAQPKAVEYVKDTGVQESIGYQLQQTR